MNLLSTQVESIINKVPLQIARETSLREAIALMANSASQSHYVVVLEEGHLAGILTERDVVQAIADGIDLDTATVNDVLKFTAITLSLSQAENLLKNSSQLIQFFHKYQIRYLPILDHENQFFGIIARENLELGGNSRNLIPEPSPQFPMITDLITPSDRETLGREESDFLFCGLSLDTIMTNVSEGIVVLSKSGEIIFANVAAGQMFNRPPDQLIGVSLGIPISLNNIFEMEIIRRNGEVGVGEVQVSQFMWDCQSCYFVSFRDITARKKADNQLWQSQQRYRTLAETVPNLIWLTDSNGTITEVNQRTQQYFGKSLEEIQTDGWLEFIHPDDRAIVKQSIFTADLLYQPYSLEYRLKRLDGVYRWHLAQVLPICDIWDEFRDSTMWLGSCTDIEDLKQTEVLLQQKANQEDLIKKITQRIRESLDLREVLNTTVEEVRRFLGADRVLIYQVFLGGTGAAIAESVGENWIKVLDIVFPEEIFPEENYERYAQGRIFALNDRKDGPILECLAEFLETIEVQAKLVVPIVQNNKLWGLIIAHQCSSPRQWQEEEINIFQQIAIQLAIAIKQSQLYEQLQAKLKQRKKIEAERQKLDLVVENSSEFMGVADLSGQMIFINRAGQNLVGIESNTNIQLLTILDFFQPKDRPLIQNEMLPHVFQENHWEGELNLWHFETQELIPVLCNIFLIKDPKTAEPTHIAGVIRDISDIKRAEQDILYALEKEKELGDLRSRFVSMASHEFRTPLAIISSSTGIMESYYQRLSEEKKQQHFKRIQSSIKHMTELLDDVLTMSKAEAEKIAFNPQSLDLLNFCQDLIAELQLSSSEHPIIFTLPENLNSHQPLIVEFDPKLLRQILTNLLTNAIKYSPPGSNINLNLKIEELKLIFEIKDKGIGIPVDDLNKLFTTFHRATNTGNIQGTGLGLAIVKKCVDLHQGEIEVHSILNEGSTFTLRLPKFFKH
ncbi:MAG: PAS domain S-box protein [Snowella sp.]